MVCLYASCNYIRFMDTIICPCKDCKNRMAWTDVTIISSYLIIRGFVEDYIVWIHHGEMVIVNDEDEEEYEMKP